MRERRVDRSLALMNHLTVSAWYDSALRCFESGNNHSLGEN